MKLYGLWMLALAAACATDMPTGYFRGAMVAWEGTPSVGVLSARSQKDGGVYECRYDGKTYLEYEKHRVKADEYLEGDPLELLVARRPGEQVCYILSGNLVPPPPKQVRPTKQQDIRAANLARAQRPVVQRRGTTHVSGAVVAISDRTITIRTRAGEAQSFALRLDTRFVADGIRVQRPDVPMNQVLEVEAGRNAEGELEAFQLTWGNLSVRP